jgi:integrase
MPEKTARMLRPDLDAAGVPPSVAAKVVDFHAFRHTYITGLVQRGASVKTCQTLARHSTPTLTLGRYAHVEEDEMRQALEGEDEG